MASNMTQPGDPLGPYDGLVLGTDAANDEPVVHIYRLTTVGSFEDDMTDCGHFFLGSWPPVPEGWWTYIGRDVPRPVTCVGCLNRNPALRGW